MTAPTRPVGLILREETMKKIIAIALLLACGLSFADSVGRAPAMRELGQSCASTPAISMQSTGTVVAQGNTGQCMGNCASEQGMCMGQCMGNGQCIASCAATHGRCVARCN